MEREGKIFHVIPYLYPKRAFDCSPINSCDNLLHFLVLTPFIEPQDELSRYCSKQNKSTYLSFGMFSREILHPHYFLIQNTQLQIFKFLRQTTAQLIIFTGNREITDTVPALHSPAILKKPGRQERFD